jgi:hypothetical protein
MNKKDKQEMMQSMYNEMKEVLGQGYVKDVYISYMMPFVEIAEYYIDNAGQDQKQGDNNER